MLSELHVPVYRVEVELTLAAVSTPRDVTLFLPPDYPIDDVFESNDAFLPVEEGGKVRLFARSTIAAISLRVDVAVDDDGLPQERRAIVTHLAGGATFEGELRWVRERGRARTTDVLNRTTRSFALYQPNRVVYVSKQHVDFVEELERS